MELTIIIFNIWKNKQHIPADGKDIIWIAITVAHISYYYVTHVHNIPVLIHFQYRGKVYNWIKTLAVSPIKIYDTSRDFYVLCTSLIQVTNENCTKELTNSIQVHINTNTNKPTVNVFIIVTSTRVCVYSKHVLCCFYCCLSHGDWQDFPENIHT